VIAITQTKGRTKARVPEDAFIVDLLRVVVNLLASGTLRAKDTADCFLISFFAILRWAKKPAKRIEKLLVVVSVANDALRYLATNFKGGSSW